MAATEIAIARLSLEDAPAGLVLSTEARWNQNEDDWRFFLMKLHARFETGSFVKGLELVTRITEAAEAANHHPDVVLTYPRVDVDLQSHDVHGVGATIEHKHWGCTGPLIIDARIKPWHAPPLIEDPQVTAKVDELARAGGPLHGVL